VGNKKRTDLFHVRACHHAAKKKRRRRGEEEEEEEEESKKSLFTDCSVEA
jgi:hypothetical protein